MQTHTRSTSVAMMGALLLMGCSRAGEGSDPHRATRSDVRPAASPRPKGTLELGSVEQQDQLLRAFQGVYHRVRGKVPYIPPRQEEEEALTALVVSLLDVVSSGRMDGFSALQHSASLQRLWVERVVVGPLQFLALTEAPGAARGWGAWIFRVGPAPGEVILQAPHTFFDMGTGPLALEALARHPFRALGFNTVHRGTKAGGEGEEPSDTDVAHNPNHPFQAVTRALERLGPLALVQLHGFKSDPETGTATVIVSNGTKDAEAPLRDAVAESLARVLEGVRVYPKDLSALGGTRNVQGKAVRSWNATPFLHLELSGSLRDKLQRDAALKGQVLDALARPLFRR